MVKSIDTVTVIYMLATAVIIAFVSGMSVGISVAEHGFRASQERRRKSA